MSCHAVSGESSEERFLLLVVKILQEGRRNVAEAFPSLSHWTRFSCCSFYVWIRSLDWICGVFRDTYTRPVFIAAQICGPGALPYPL